MIPQIMKDGILAAGKRRQRLVLLVGSPRSGKTALLQDIASSHDLQLINVNLRLSELLLDLTQQQRAVRAHRLLAELADDTPGDLLLLDNIELLFGVELKLDPLRLLQGLSRNRTLIASWTGEFIGERLVYAEPSHPEFRRYDHPDAIIVPAPDLARTSTQNSNPDIMGKTEGPQ